MAEHRPFPPSPRRRALARQAGLHAASPWLVAAAAAAAIVLALAALGGSLADQLAAAIAAACRARPELGPGGIAPRALALTTVRLALPALTVAAIAAVLAHLAQTRAPWLPRRRIRGAPALDAGPAPRARRAAGELAAAAILASLAFAWLWHAAPRLAMLSTLAPASLRAAGAGLVLDLVAALTVGWLVLAVIDAVARHAALARALAMTAAERREDARLAGADPRWQARRAQVQRGPALADAITGATFLLIGDDTAVAIAWDPVRQPIPVRTATGRGPRARHLLALARRDRLAIHRAPALAAALVGGDGPIAEPHWPALAHIVAAVAARRDRAPPAQTG
jgi:flagellar biosynthesis protein FlhB